MIIIEKNVGTKIPYEVTGTKITFDDDLTINLKKREQDDPVHIDVCFDRDGNLVTGSGNIWQYVAEIDIPARRYTEPAGEDEASEAIPLDMDLVTLSLWAVE